MTAKQRTIFLDYAAGTEGNPSSIHSVGRAAKKELEDARAAIGKVLNCRPEEIVFTGSGTEANNLAILGILPRDGHIISTNIEHHSVLRPLEKRSNVTYVLVKQNGVVDPEDIKRALRPNTVLVSVIYANNEIGAIQPIKAIKKAIGKVLLHVDACQAAGALDINVQNLGVDLMTLNAAKIHGPNGIGCLFVRRGTPIAPIIFGGDQERGLRAGTESPVLAAGFAKALEIADRTKERESARLTKLRDYAIERILKEIPNSKLNGDPIQRLPNNINLSFIGVDSEMLVLALDQYGICVSTGAACTTSSNEPSHVIAALSPPTPSYSKRGPEGAIQKGNIRITLGRSTKKKDLDFTIEKIKTYLRL